MKIKKALSVLLCLSILVSLAACSGKSDEAVTAFQTQSDASAYTQPVYSAKAASVRKNETVYVNLDASGKILSTTVTDWLHTPAAEVYIDDMSDLKNITNLKSELLPVETENGIRWNMDATDLYYSGTTNKKPPVDLSLTYYLDGKKISPEDIAGKSGNVRIETKMKNNCKTDAEVGGKKVKMFLPVAVIGVAILDEARFSGVTVENGLTLGDASKEILVGVCFPGMDESLGLSDMNLSTFAGYNISDCCAFSADVVDFQIDNMYYVVLPLCAMNSGMVVPDSLDALNNDIKLLTNIVNAVSAVDFSSVMQALSANPDSIESLTAMVQSAASLYSENKELLHVLSKYLTDENVQALAKVLEDADEAQVLEALKLMQNPIMQAFIKGLPELMDDLDVLLPVLEEMQQEMQTPEIRQSLDNMPETLDTLAVLLNGLDQNRELVEALANTVGDDKTEVIDQILSGITETDFETSILNYDGVIAHSDELLANIKAWISAGMDYKIFTCAPDDMQTNLMFIYQTRSVKYTEPSTQLSEETAEPWYKKLFGFLK